MAFSKAMPEAFRVTLFNGKLVLQYYPADNLQYYPCHLIFFTSILVTTAIEKRDTKSFRIGSLKAILKFCTANTKDLSFGFPFTVL